MHRWLVAAAAVLTALIALPSTATACSRDDKSYFDGFPDTSCLLLPTTNIEPDTFGGLRLKTNGVPVQATWDEKAHFETGISYSNQTFGPVWRSTLEIVGGTGTTAALELPKTTMPLTPLAAPVISPSAPDLLDNYSVSDPSVVKVGNEYVMYYAGVAEDGSGPAIFRLTSTTGTFTRPAAAEHQPVLQGQAGAFDAAGAFGPDVVHDPNDASAPFKMWYTGRGSVFDQIGYATSTDGESWTKYDSPDDPDALPNPVVPVGLPGSQDSFAAAHPSVLRDGGLWKMWYEGDDSTKKSIAYATSTDGKTWSKAGAVIESGTGNLALGVFAPTVWKEPGDPKPFKMLVGGRAETGQGIKTKLLDYESATGLEPWDSGSVALNPGSFASTNLGSPEVVATAAGAIEKLFFSGNSTSATDPDPQDQIGVAGNTGGTAQTIALGLPTPSPKFDARQAYGLSSVDPGGTPDLLPGVYTGLNSDGVPRLGAAKTKEDGTWEKVAGTQADGSILPIGSNNQFDEDGHSDPHLIHQTDMSASPIDYALFFTGVNDGVETIGVITGEEQATSKLPDQTKWANPGANAAFGLGTAGQFDDVGVSHPSVVQLNVNDWAMYYTAQGSTAGTSIGRALSTGGPFALFGSRAAITLNAATAGTPAHTCDLNGRRDPEAVVVNSVVHLLFVGIENVDHDSDPGTALVPLERTCLAKATDAAGTTFDRLGPVLNPSQVPHRFDESGIAPSSVFADATTAGSVLRVLTTGTDRRTRRRSGATSTALPLAVSATVGIPNGWATYEFGDVTTAIRDFQRIVGTATGTGTEIWMSVLQPYSDASNQYWSRPFPVDPFQQDGQPLNFQIGGEDGGVRAVRWQARLRRPTQGDPPHLDKITLDHADISFFASGSATTQDITPPSEFTLKSWTSLTVASSLFAPLGAGSGGGTVTVLDDLGNTLVAPTNLTLPGDTTVSLSGVDAAAKPKLRVKFDLTSANGQASPLVESLKVDYVAVSPEGNPDGDGDGIPDASDACPAQAGAASAAGCPDADGDGVADAQDACPTLPAAGKANGCPDADGDGVADPNDACPAIPAPGSPNGCPITMTLTASATALVYGKSAVLSGTLLRGVLPVAGQIVTVLAQPVGAAAPTALGTAVTDITGKWVLTVKPKLHTTYVVVLAGVAAPAPVVIQVAHKLTLSVKLSGRRATFKGVLSPKHARRYVTIQRKSGTKWVKVTRVRTNRRSTFTYAKSFKKGRHQFRAITGADKQHLAGRSSARRVTVR